VRQRRKINERGLLNSFSNRSPAGGVHGSVVLSGEVVSRTSRRGRSAEDLRK
jgi:hypothetical protein